jgi:hypothetical protein
MLVFKRWRTLEKLVLDDCKYDSQVLMRLKKERPTLLVTGASEWGFCPVPHQGAESNLSAGSNPPVRHTACTLPPAPGQGETLPKVVEAYTPASQTQTRKVSEVIPSADVKSITRLILLSKGSPVVNGFRPDYDADKLFAQLFRENAPLETGVGRSAYEVTLAQYVIVLKDYSTCFVEVLCDTLHRRDVARLVVRGNGFGGSVRLKTEIE